MSRRGSRADNGPDDGRRLTRGQLVRRRLLRTEAVYRVIGENKRGVEVEVVEAEGLQPGSRFTFSVEDVMSMTAVDPPQTASRTDESAANPE
jgi:hypothetical protein